jgi:hypothetical protein
VLQSPSGVSPVKVGAPKAHLGLKLRLSSRPAEPLRLLGRRSVDLAGHARTVFPPRTRAREPARRRGDGEEDRAVSLGEALELTLLIARKDPRRHPYAV